MAMSWKWWCHSYGVSSRAEDVAAIERSVLQADGRTGHELRFAVFKADEVAPVWTSYVRKIRDESYRLTDGDMQELRRAGYSEDAIFKVPIVAALGAARLRLDAGLRALSQAK